MSKQMKPSDDIWELNDGDILVLGDENGHIYEVPWNSHQKVESEYTTAGWKKGSKLKEVIRLMDDTLPVLIEKEDENETK